MTLCKARLSCFINTACNNRPRLLALWHCLLVKVLADVTHWEGLVVTRRQKDALLLSKPLHNLLFHHAANFEGPERDFFGFEIACMAAVGRGW